MEGTSGGGQSTFCFRRWHGRQAMWVMPLRFPWVGCCRRLSAGSGLPDGPDGGGTDMAAEAAAAEPAARARSR